MYSRIKEAVINFFKQEDYNIYGQCTHKKAYALIGERLSGPNLIIETSTDLDYLERKLYDIKLVVSRAYDKINNLEVFESFSNAHIEEIKDSSLTTYNWWFSFDLNKNIMDVQLAVEETDYSDSKIDYTDYRGHKLLYIVSSGFNIDDVILDIKSQIDNLKPSKHVRKVSSLQNKLNKMLDSGLKTSL